MKRRSIVTIHPTMPALPRDCPCHSTLRYVACCAAAHRGHVEAATPEALMRSRFAAFALGLGDYLVKTLAEGHPDLLLPRGELALSFSRAHEKRRFLDLRILHASAEGPAGEVLFYARIFERGADRSFAELSTFRREGEAWRYATGVLVPAARLPKDARGLDRSAFLELARESAEEERP
jgi:SEC-C motif-containing protein